MRTLTVHLDTHVDLVFRRVRNAGLDQNIRITAEIDAWTVLV